MSSRWKPGEIPPNSKPFPKGVSGNPGGKPKDLIKATREKYRDDVPKILEVFRDLALGRTPTGYDGAEVRTSDRIKAGQDILDRVLGKAPQTIDGSLELGARPDQLALIAALQLTPQERRNKLAEIDAEDARALEEGPLGGDVDPIDE